MKDIDFISFVVEESSSSLELINKLEIIKIINPELLNKSELWLKCFNKFSNFCLFASPKFKENEQFVESAVISTASNILFMNRAFTFEELKNFVNLNPFVSIYSVEFVNEFEQDLLHFEALKKTGIYTFYENIKNDALKEDILIDVYFNKFEVKSENLIKEASNFVKSLDKKDLELIKNLRK